MAEGAPDDRPRREDLGAVLEIIRLLWAVDNGLHATSKRMTEIMGVTGQQRLLIRLIGKFPGATSGELADILEMPQSSISAIVELLVRRGMARRDRDAEDRRRLRISLTPRGKEIDAEWVGTVEASVRRALQKADAAKIRTLEELLGRLAAELKTDRRGRASG
jgi:DNA-binding MarR family transcriptional regulator